MDKPVRTWEEFTVELHKQFYMEYSENEAYVKFFVWIIKDNFDNT